MKFATYIAAAAFVATATALARPPVCDVTCNRAYQNCVKTTPQDVCRQQLDDCIERCLDCPPGRLCP
ncbi:hypothetical protein GQ42DRAFT_41205 [Ramicandelaber brevisporus]|nr:hypothetical protein GQ42DRAFT_41205 [Ramicandelaber brevisporus]